ncbi:unnamed protein product [Gordionus sp. m RMFG-2023]|uniref:uncharacterized protein LOC135925492 n=1 Tax=Gordionus sp. m RMFG-2023 TaxID=3053472 RepID=UPI0030DE2D53
MGSLPREEYGLKKYSSAHMNPNIFDNPLEDDVSPKKSYLKDKFDKFKDMDYELTEDQNEQIKATITTFTCLFLDQLLSQPFITISTQCQLHLDSKKYHINPITLMTPTINIIKTQGMFCLWKGLTTTLIVNGLSTVTENFLSDILQYPKDVNFTKSSSKEICQHFILKCLTYSLMCPFYIANLIQIVQSSIITLDEPSSSSSSIYSIIPRNVVDLFRDAFHITKSAILGTTLFGRSVAEPLAKRSSGGAMSWIYDDKSNRVGALFLALISAFIIRYIAERLCEALAGKVANRMVVKNIKKSYKKRKRFDNRKYNHTSDFEDEEELTGDGFIKVPSKHSGIDTRRCYVTALTCKLWGRMGASFVCYPLYCVTNLVLLRMLGRTLPRKILLIDDMDSGLRIVPISHHFAPVSTYSSGININMGIHQPIKILGMTELFKGFGCLAYHAIVRIGLIKIAEIIIKSPLMNN